MTEEQKHSAQDILATLISFDCQGIDCYDCPFSYNNGSCMVTTAHAKFDELNKSMVTRTYVKADELNMKGEN